MHRPAHRTRAAAVGLLAALLLAGCTSAGSDSDGTSSPTSSANPAQAASAATIAAGSARVLGAVVITEGAQDVSAEVSGLQDFSSGDMKLTVTTKILNKTSTINQRVVDGTAYSQLVGPGDTWFATAAVTASTGASPLEALEAMGQLTDVTQAGPDTINGKAVTAYTASMAIEDALPMDGLDESSQAQLQTVIDNAGPDAVSFRFFVDEQGRVVRTVRKVRLSAPSKPEQLMSTTMNLSDFGVPVKVTAPPADKVQAPGGS